MNSSQKYSVAVFLLLSMAFLSAVFALQGTLLTPMIDFYSLPTDQQGLAGSATFFGGIAALMIAFLLQGRLKKRLLLKWSMCVVALGLILLFLAPGYPLYVAAWFVTGFGLGLMDTLLSACMADLFTGRRAVIMMCMLHTAYGLSSVLTPMGFSAMLRWGAGWKSLHLPVGFYGLLVAGCAALAARIFSIPDPEKPDKNPLRLSGILPALSRGGLLLLTAAIFFHGIFLSGLNTWVNRYAEGVGAGFLPAQSCVFLGLMLSRLLIPFLPLKTEKYVCAAGILGAAALLLGLYGGSATLFYGMLVLSGLLFGALIPCIITIACGRQRQNTLLATTGIMLALYLGQSLSSPVIAALEKLLSLRAGMALCALCMVLCSLCCIVDLRRQKPADPKED